MAKKLHDLDGTLWLVFTHRADGRNRTKWLNHATLKQALDFARSEWPDEKIQGGREATPAEVAQYNALARKILD